MRRYVVLGAGAIGAGVGGLLQRTGADVTLVARGAHLEALRRDGLALAVGHAEQRVPVAAVAGPEAVHWTEDTIVLLCVKSHQTSAALTSLVAHAPRSTPVVCVQNGVANEREALRLFSHVHGICVMMPTSHLEPGRVVLHSAGRPGLLDVGLATGGTDEVDRAVAGDLREAGFDSVARDDVMAWKRRKLVMNLGNAVDAAFVDDAHADRLVELARAEGEHVLAVAGLPVVSPERDRERRGELLRPLVRREQAGSSSWQSLARATGEVEVDYLNGEIVLLGRLHGVPAPVNALLQETLSRLARERAGTRTESAAELLARL